MSFYIKREISENLHKFATFFPVVAILGPRQSGKTTLAKNAFKNYHYINMENIGLREIATSDPSGFLEKLLEHSGVIIDEFQNVPELLSYIQIVVDENPSKRGFFILTGSHNFLMNEAISQSLAGRVGILTLLPLSNKEILDANLQSKFSIEAVFKGCYPKLFEEGALSPEFVYPSYIQTYIERDARSIVNITDLSLFKKFMSLCAGRIGQILNVSSLATDCGISMQTVKSWLSILESSYIIYLLQPYHKNYNKRLVKSPILYFYDTGVACSLLNIISSDQLDNHYLRGHLFENFIITDIQKQFYNRAKIPAIYFWRDSHGNEVDCVVDIAGQLLPIEIKSSMTMSANFIKGLLYWQDLASVQKGFLVYAGNQNVKIKNVEIIAWKYFSVF